MCIAKYLILMHFNVFNIISLWLCVSAEYSLAVNQTAGNNQAITKNVGTIIQEKATQGKCIHTGVINNKNN